jgi:ATP-dependent Clp protease ATP-binding subunit ClpB
MSEYQERHAVARLIGAPPGYVGYEEGGQLTEAIRRRPYSVILLDEIEKAHQDAFNILLQVLDEGRLTDGQGRTVDFKNAVVIMTSNLGSRWFFEEWLSPDERRERVIEEVYKTFRPEFLNRLDEIIVFDPLGKDEIASIVEIQVRELQERLAAKRLELRLTDAAREYLAEKGYDPNFGARPLKRLIQREVADALANRLLAGDIAEGSVVEIDRDGEGLVFRTAQAVAAS